MYYTTPYVEDKCSSNILYAGGNYISITNSITDFLRTFQDGIIYIYFSSNQKYLREYAYLVYNTFYNYNYNVYISSYSFDSYTVSSTANSFCYRMNSSNSELVFISFLTDYAQKHFFEELITATCNTFTVISTTPSYEELYDFKVVKNTYFIGISSPTEGFYRDIYRINEFALYLYHNVSKNITKDMSLTYQQFIEMNHYKSIIVNNDEWFFISNNNIHAAIGYYYYDGMNYSIYNKTFINFRPYDTSSPYVCFPFDGGKTIDNSIDIPIFFNLSNNNVIRERLILDALSTGLDYLNMYQHGIANHRLRHKLYDLSELPAYYEERKDQQVIIFGGDTISDFDVIYKFIEDKENILLFVVSDMVGRQCYSNTVFTGLRLPVYIETLMSEFIYREYTSVIVYIDESTFPVSDFKYIMEKAYDDVINIVKFTEVKSNDDIDNAITDLVDFSLTLDPEKTLILLALNPLYIKRFILAYNTFLYRVAILRSSVNELALIMDVNLLDGVLFLTNNVNNEDSFYDKQISKYKTNGLYSNQFVSTIEAIGALYLSIENCEGVIDVKCMKKQIPGMKIRSPEGIIVGTDSFYFEKHLAIITINNHNGFDVMANNEDLVRPYIYSLDLKKYSLSQCRKVYPREKAEYSVLIILDTTGTNSLGQLELYRTYIIAFDKVNEQQNLNNTYYYYKFFNSESDSSKCKNDVQLILQNTPIDVIFFSSTSSCRKQLNTVKEANNIPIFVVTNTEGEECKENMFYGGYTPYVAMSILSSYFITEFQEYQAVMIIEGINSWSFISELVKRVIPEYIIHISVQIIVPNMTVSEAYTIVENEFNKHPNKNSLIIFLASEYYINEYAKIANDDVEYNTHRIRTEKILLCFWCQILDFKTFPFTHVDYIAEFEYPEDVNDDIREYFKSVIRYNDNYLSDKSFFAFGILYFWSDIVAEVGNSELSSIQSVIYNKEYDFHGFKIQFGSNNRQIKTVSLIRSISTLRMRVVDHTFSKIVLPYLKDYYYSSKYYQCDWVERKNDHYLVDSRYIGLFCSYSDYYTKAIVTSCELLLIYINYINNKEGGILGKWIIPIYLSYSSVDLDSFDQTIRMYNIDIVIGTYAPSVNIDPDEYLRENKILFIQTGHNYGDSCSPYKFHTGPTLWQYLTPLSLLISQKNYRIVIVGNDKYYHELITKYFKNVLQSVGLELSGDLLYDIDNKYINGTINELMKKCVTPCAIVSHLLGDYNDLFFEYLYYNNFTSRYGYDPFSIGLAETIYNENRRIYNGTVVIQSFFDNVKSNFIEFSTILSQIENEADYVYSMIPTYFTYQLIGGFIAYKNAVEELSDFNTTILARYISDAFSTMNIDETRYSILQLYGMQIFNDKDLDTIVYNVKLDSNPKPGFVINVANGSLPLDSVCLSSGKNQTYYHLIIVTDNTYNSAMTNLNNIIVMNSLFEQVKDSNNATLFVLKIINYQNSAQFKSQLISIQEHIDKYAAIFGCKSINCYNIINQYLGKTNLPFYYLGYSFEEYVNINSYFIGPTPYQLFEFTFHYIDYMKNKLVMNTPTLALIYDVNYPKLLDLFRDEAKEYNFEIVNECPVNPDDGLSSQFIECLISWSNTRIFPIHIIYLLPGGYYEFYTIHVKYPRFSSLFYYYFLTYDGDQISPIQLSIYEHYYIIHTHTNSYEYPLSISYIYLLQSTFDRLWINSYFKSSFYSSLHIYDEVLRSAIVYTKTSPSVVQMQSMTQLMSFSTIYGELIPTSTNYFIRTLAVSQMDISTFDFVNVYRISNYTIPPFDPLPDGFEIPVNILKYPKATQGLVYGFAAETVVMILLFMFLLWKQRKNPIMRKDSMNLLQTSMITLLFAPITAIFFVIEPSEKNFICMLRIAMLCVTLLFQVSIVFMKAYRVKKLLFNPTREKVAISDGVIFRNVFIVMAVEIVYLIIWGFVQPSNLSYTSDESDNPLEIRKYPICRTPYLMFAIQCVGIGLYIVWGVYNIFKLRHVGRDIMNSTSLGWSAFVFAIVAILFGPLAFILGKEPKILIVVQGLAIIVTTHVFLFSYIGSKLLLLWKNVSDEDISDSDDDGLTTQAPLKGGGGKGSYLNTGLFNTGLSAVNTRTNNNKTKVLPEYTQMYGYVISRPGGGGGGVRQNGRGLSPALVGSPLIGPTPVMEGTLPSGIPSGTGPSNQQSPGLSSPPSNVGLAKGLDTSMLMKKLENLQFLPNDSTVGGGDSVSYKPKASRSRNIPGSVNGTVLTDASSQESYASFNTNYNNNNNK